MTEQARINNDNDKIPLTENGKNPITDTFGLEISGNDTLTLSTGTYLLSSIKVSGNAKLKCSGQIVILTTGAISITGDGKVNSEHTAIALSLFCNTEEEVKISGNGNLTGIVYAPKSKFDISGNGMLSGNVFVKEASLSGNTIIKPSTTTTGSGYGSMALKPSLALDPTFKLGEVYAFPNPAKGGYRPTIHIECGIADSVEIRIYNIAGELVHQTELSGDTYQVLSNKYYYYEYPWDISNIASGVYIYLIKAEKQGEQPIKVLKKCAVIK